MRVISDVNVRSGVGVWGVGKEALRGDGGGVGRGRDEALEVGTEMVLVWERRGIVEVGTESVRTWDGGAVLGLVEVVGLESVSGRGVRGYGRCVVGGGTPWVVGDGRRGWWVGGVRCLLVLIGLDKQVFGALVVAMAADDGCWVFVVPSRFVALREATLRLEGFRSGIVQGTRSGPGG